MTENKDFVMMWKI